MPDQADSTHTCEVCGTSYPVPSLTRDCEQRHTHPLRAQDVPALLPKTID